MKAFSSSARHCLPRHRQGHPLGEGVEGEWRGGDKRERRGGMDGVEGKGGEGRGGRGEGEEEGR